MTLTSDHVATGMACLGPGLHRVLGTCAKSSGLGLLSVDLQVHQEGFIRRASHRAMLQCYQASSQSP